MRTIALAVALFAMFVPPDAGQRRDAVGDLHALPPALRCALDASAFEPIHPPAPDDWLASHTEQGQTFEAFARSRPNRPDAQRHTIYLQPLGTFELGSVREFTEAFFMMPVVVRPPLDLRTAPITSRTNPHSGQQQLLTTDILAFLRRQVPLEAFCMLGITMVDLYPDPSWNFVFGQAALRDRVGVYSFARYADGSNAVLHRSCKVIAHETSHMFGIEHCIYFRCVLNGSNHLGEADARPMHLCPVDLRKLQWSLGFDVIDRYRRLRAVCQRAGFADEARWCEREIERCGKS